MSRKAVVNLPIELGKLQMTSELLEIEDITLEEVVALADEERLFAIIDSCDEPQVPEKMQELGEDRAMCLYAGESARDYATFAPYLALCDSELLEWIRETLWEGPWGVFLVSNEDLGEVWRHCRRFLVVEEPEGSWLYFRYYDPRIMEVFLVACTDEEIRRFFGSLRSIVTVGKQEEGRTIKKYSKPDGTSDLQNAGFVFNMRDEHMEGFSEVALQTLKERVFEHLQESFPEECSRLRKDGVRERIDCGIERAAGYGISEERNVRKFIDLMFVLGDDFDENQQMRWARDILKSDKFADETAKMDELWEEAEEKVKLD